jgi:methyl-accepting chemotaxis protein
MQITEISAASQNLAQGASEQAASLEGTSDAEEITSMTRHNSENSRLAAEEMERATSMVAESGRSLNEMIASMAEIRGASERIVKIIEVIDQISFQTNILALNAAVEAARAGESGAGSAVVADEVRALAQRSTQSARDMLVLVADSAEKSHAGDARLQQVVQAFTRISESAGKVKTLIDQVSSGSVEQRRGVEQVLRSIQEMEKVTQATASSYEQSAATSEELSAQAESMTAIGADLKSAVKG